MSDKFLVNGDLRESDEHFPRRRHGDGIDPLTGEHMGHREQCVMCGDWLDPDDQDWVEGPFTREFDWDSRPGEPCKVFCRKHYAKTGLRGRQRRPPGELSCAGLVVAACVIAGAVLLAMVDILRWLLG